MKTTVITIVLLALMSTAFSSDYEAILKNTVLKMDSAKSVADYEQCIHVFERLPAGDDWYVPYYTAFCYGLMSQVESDSDKKEKILESAEQSLERAMGLSPDNDELYVLKAFILQMQIQVNPGSRGAVYTPKVFKALDQAQELNPDNPRQYYLRGQQLINMPKFFGGGGEKALPSFQEGLVKYALFEQPNEYHPHWGKNTCKQMIGVCEKMIAEEN